MENYFQILFIKDRNNYNSLKFLIKQKKNANIPNTSWRQSFTMRTREM